MRQILGGHMAGRRMRSWRVWLLVIGLLAGCGTRNVPVTPPTPLLPTRMAVAELPATPSMTPEATITPPAAPIPLPSRASPIAAMAAATAAATATAVPTPSPTLLPPTPEPVAAPTCRDAALLALVQPQWVVKEGPWPRPAAVSGLLGRAPARDLQLLHLGFDVEGDPYFVGDLLDVLDRRQVKTTFFVLGSWADTYPDWVQEMARRGHEMATHGYTHRDMSALTAEQVSWELRQTETAVSTLTGQSTKPWLRPPFGLYSDESAQAAYAAGYTTVIWSGSSNDWRSGMDATKMCETLRQYAMPGAILYTHTNRGDIVEAVDRFLAEEQLHGFTFVPLSVLMADDPAAWLEAASSAP